MKLNALEVGGRRAERFFGDFVIGMARRTADDESGAGAAAQG
jgi:hypothetical protein